MSELSEYQQACDYWQDRAEKAERERDEARAILAGTDAGSLPNEFTLAMVAQQRMADLAHAWDRVERGDKRCQTYEADLAALASCDGSPEGVETKAPSHSDDSAVPKADALPLSDHQTEGE